MEEGRGNGAHAESTDASSMHFDDPVTLQASFLEPIEDTTGGKLAPFLAEFAKMQQALKKSHESESRFVNKCRELAQSLTEVNDRSADLEQEEADSRKKLEILQKQSEMAKENKEKMSKEIGERKMVINTMRAEVSMLRKKLETWSKVLQEQQQQVIGALEQELLSLVSARDKGVRHLTFVRQENTTLYGRVEQLENDKRAQMEDISDLARRTKEIDGACRDEMMRKDELEAKTAEMKELCEQLSLEISRKVDRTRKGKQELAKEKIQLKDSMKLGTNSSTKLAQLNEEAQDLEDQFQAQQDVTEEVIKSMEAIQIAYEGDKEIVAQCAREAKRKRAMLDKLREKMRVAEENLSAIEATRSSWNERLEQRRAELKAAGVAAAVAARAIDVAAREREVLNHDHASMTEGLAAKRNALHVSENQSRNMENELKAFNASVKAWKALIEQLLQDTDTFKNELAMKQERTRKAVEKSAAKDMQILAMQKSIIEQEGKRRQQMNLLEAVKSDRNMYSKTLLEHKHEMSEYKRVFDSLNHSISHMQQELNDKETAFVSENLLVEQVDDDIRTTDRKSKHIHQCWVATHERVKGQAAQIAKLSRIIEEADEEIQAQTKQYNAVVNEERVLSKQMVKRNDELSDVYEQLRLHHSMMQKGDEHYRDRRAQCDQMLRVHAQLSEELSAINQDRSEMDQFQSSINKLEKQLVKENLKARALEDELKKPMNIHRWRQLQDTNVDTFTLIESIQGLQKNIIAKSDELTEKDAKIEQKERLYVDLRRILARQLGQEAHEQLRVYKATIKEKSNKHRQMKAELKLCQAKAYELKYEVEQLYRSLDLVKLTYLEKLRADARARSRGAAQQSGGSNLTGNGEDSRNGAYGGLDDGSYNDSERKMSLDHDDKDVKGHDAADGQPGELVKSLYSAIDAGAGEKFEVGGK